MKTVSDRVEQSERMLRNKQEELQERLNQQLKTFHDEMDIMKSQFQNTLDEHSTLIEVNKA